MQAVRHARLPLRAVHPAPTFTQSGFAMLRTTTARLLVGCALALARQGHAQSSDTVQFRQLAFSIGIAQTDRLDGAVSPSRFDGQGLDLALSAANTIGPATVMGSLRYGSRSLGPADLSLLGERLTEGEFHMDLLPGQRADEFITFGIDAQATIAVTTHRYEDSDPAKSYLFGTTMFGPVLFARHVLGRGVLSAQVTLPVAGVVTQPYSALWSERSAIDVTPVTLASLQSTSAIISWAASSRQYGGMLLQYHLGFLRYDGTLPVRGLSQSFALGIVR
jgi:hypothetical protein